MAIHHHFHVFVHWVGSISELKKPGLNESSILHKKSFKVYELIFNIKQNVPVLVSKMSLQGANIFSHLMHLLLR